MGRLNQLLAPEQTTTRGRLAPRLTDVEVPVIETKPQGLIERTAESVGAFANGEVPLRAVAREIPASAMKVGGAFATTFVPAITNFFKTTGSILGEGLAYATSKNVREQYKAGNLDILPTITETTQADLAKKTIAAGIETAVYRSFPKIAQMNLKARGGAGALQGVGFAVSEGLAHDKSPEEIIKSLPAYGVLGGTVGVITPYLMPILKSEMKLLPKEFKSMFKGIQREATQGVKPGERRLSVALEGGDETAVSITRQGEAPVAPEPAPTAPITPKVENPLAQKAVAEGNGAVKVADEIIPETRTTRVPGEQLPVGEGEVAVSRLESRIKGTLDDVPVQRAEESGITTYKQMNKAEQIREAVKYVERNPDEALDVLRGDKSAPKGLLHNSIALALEEKAVLASDRNLAIKLASLRSTRAGQEISILTEAAPDNPISAINEIIKARAARATRKLKGDPAKEIARQTKEASVELSKGQLKIAEAEKVLNDIVC